MDRHRTDHLTSADVLLRDGGLAVIRPMRADDAASVVDLHDRVSDDAVRLRFFSTSRRAAHEYAAHLAHDDTVLALVALVRGRLVGVATAEPEDHLSAEVSFLIDDDQHGRGLGSLLLEHLAAAGADRGIRRFTAEVLGENHPMLGVFWEAGFSLTRTTTDGIVDIAMDTDTTPRALAAADERECLAEASSLRRVLRPQGVAVVGVKRDGSGIGAAVLRSIRDGGFRGRLYVVHPAGEPILGVPAYPTFADLPEPVDLAVVAVPAAGAVLAVSEAGRSGVAGAVVLSSGFREVDEEGASLEAGLLSAAREVGVRVIGPNCLGLLANHPDVSLNATFTDAVPPPGGFAIGSQSGGVGIVVLDAARARGLGVNSLISLGNKVDVSGNDLLAAWVDDPSVTSIGLYLESFGNAPKFARLARRVAERKPLLAVVGGLSASGGRAGASHTAGAATSAVGVDTLFRHCGVIRCDGADEMVATALLLQRQPLPRGPRLGIVSNAGGMGVLGADLAEAHGLTVPRLTPELGADVARHVRGTSGTGNPVDAGAGAGPDDLAGATSLLLSSGEVDAVLAVLVATTVTDVPGCLRALEALQEQRPERPLLVVTLAGQVPQSVRDRLSIFGSCHEAIAALSKVVRYAEWLSVAPDPQQPRDVGRSLAAQDEALRALENAHDGWIAPDAADRLLDPYDVSLVGRVVVGPAAALVAAEQVGFPVVVKVADPAVVHRSDRGLVRVGLRNVADVADATLAFATELGHEDVPVLVQPMESGVELAVGLVRDPVFGPLVMVATGGVAIDVWDDRAFLLTPVSAADAARAVRSLRSWPLLAGHRGSAPCDVAAIEDLIVAIGRVAEEVPQVVELDLNPVLVGTSGLHVVDLKLRLAPASDNPTMTLRMLGDSTTARES